MRHKGKITDWNDSKGFGFVVPHGGGARAFVHIKAFAQRGRRPAEGDFITYDVTQDSRKRTNAINIRYAGDVASKRRSPSFGYLPYLTVLVFAALITALVGFGRLPMQILFIYITASGIAFLAFAFDKAAAMNKRWRTRENTLHLLSLIGGWPGAFIAQRMFRHKTKKDEFQTVFWFTVAANCAALFWFTSVEGAKFLHAVLNL